MTYFQTKEVVEFLIEEVTKKWITLKGLY
jgi:hypothetical protein